MNATELFLKDGRSAGVHYCDKCKGVHRDQPSAEQCCQPYKCKTCNKDIERYHTLCTECITSARLIKDHDEFEKAEKVSDADYDGPVYLDGTGNDGYSASVEELIDEMHDNCDIPAYAWACDVSPTVTLDIGDILEHATQEAHEDFDPDCLDGIPALKAAIAAFNELNKDKVSWMVSHKKAVLITPPIPETTPANDINT